MTRSVRKWWFGHHLCSRFRRLRIESLEDRRVLGGGGENMLLVVNPGDENALRIANAYQQLRAIPDSHFVFIEPPASKGSYKSDLTKAEFNELYVAPLASQIAARGLDQIDYIATLGEPSRYTAAPHISADTSNSLTYGLMLLDPLSGGLDSDNAVYSTTGLYQNPSSIPVGSNPAIHHSQHYSVNYGAAGSLDTQYYMAGALGYTWIRGNTAEQVIANLERAAAADGTHPSGTIYFEENDDVRSNIRESQWAATKTQLDARGIPWLQERNVSGSTPLNRDDVLGAVIGSAAQVQPNGSTYLPGSWADNVTSYGCTWSDRGQSKDPSILATGAAATTGSVVEPYAIASRFTNSSVHVFLADGSTTGEAFAKSVAIPDIQLFLGDLLAQPGSDIPAVTITAGHDGATVSGPITLGASAALANAHIATSVDRLELLLDGRIVGTISGSSGSFDIDTTTLDDGRHELRVVAVNNAQAESEGYTLRNVFVNNHGRSVATGVGNLTLTGDEVQPVSVTAQAGDGTVLRIELRNLGRSLGEIGGSGGDIDVDASSLAYGDNRLTPVAVFSDGTETAGTSMVVHRDPVVVAGQAPTPNLVAGLKAEYFFGNGGTSIAASDFAGTPDLTVGHKTLNLYSGLATSLDRSPATLATTDIDHLALRLSGKFNVTADTAGEYQFYLWKANDSAEILIDGRRVAGFDGAGNGATTSQVSGIFLDPGEHDFVLLAANVASGSRPTYFDLSCEYRGPDGITRLVDSNHFAFANQAPELDNSGAMSLTAIEEDDASNAGTLVADILASAGGNRILDADPGAAKGIAVIGADFQGGTWQYRIGATGAWTDLERPSAQSACLLSADSATWIRFVSSANWNGTLSSALTFCAWDRSSGAAGDTADTTSNGGSTAFSTAVETASLSVTPVEDPPSIAAGAVEASMVLDAGITPLGLHNLDVTAGGTDEQAQTLTFTVATVPDPARGSIVRSGDLTPLGVGQTITAEELRGLRFAAAGGSSSAAETFAFTVADNGGLAPVTFTMPLEIVHYNPVSLLGDLETTAESSDPANFVDLGGIAYFTASDPLHGNELWRSDSTADGTWLVKDIQPGTRSSSISGLTCVAGMLYFSANDGATGQELWASDGTPGGTYLVEDLYPGFSTSGVPVSSAPGNLANLAGTLVFTATSSGKGTELWRSDGTPGGTYPVKDIYSGSSSSSPARLTVIGGTVCFTANDGTNGTELWKSDGTEAGTVPVKNLTPGSAGSTISAMAAAGSMLFFTFNNAASGTELWKSDGSEAGTQLVLDIVAGSGSSSPANLTAAGNVLFFTATDPSGTELWRSDGSPDGTRMVADVNPGSASSAPVYLTDVGGTLFFRARDGTSGIELWCSDGTTAARVANIYTGSGDSNPANLTNVGGTLFFTATSSAHGTELWSSDGTTAGTVLVKDLVPGSGSGSYANLAAAGGELFFRGSATSTDRELWVSDGSDSGTVRVKDIAAGATATSNPGNFTELNGKLCFSATTTAAGSELWTSDGTPGGTFLLKDVNPGPGSGNAANLCNAGGRLYFSANSGSTGTELWTSDGTAGGTVLVKDINPGSGSSSPASFVNVGGAVFFTANDGTAGTELWRTDGTPDGTVLVKDLTPGSGSSTIANLIRLGSTLLFTFNSTSSGTELWKSDCTDAGTMLVTDINPGTASSAPSSLTVFGTYVYFSASDGSAGTELWRSDGTAAGTARVYDIYSGSGSSSPSKLTVLGNMLLFAATDATYGRELWRTSGSLYAYRVMDIYSGASSSSPTGLTVFNDRVYFTAYTSEAGYELWQTNGTLSGTALVQDIRPGSAWSNTSWLTALGNKLYFRADDGTSGGELWQSDGTSAGTGAVADSLPGSGDSYPQYLTVAGGKLFFRATDGVAGDEVWCWSDAAPTTAGVADVMASSTDPPARIDLWAAFQDDIQLDSALQYTITADSNPSLFSSTVIDAATGKLILAYDHWANGSAGLTVRAADAADQWVETSFTVQVTYVDQAPTATVSLDSHTPFTNDLLTATATRSDPDGDPVSLTFQWSVDGTLKQTRTLADALTDTFDLSIAGNGDSGNVITVQVTPHDGFVDGTTVADTATVADSAPTVAAPASADPSPVTGTTVTLSVLGADVDAEEGSLTYTWVATTLPGGAAVPAFSPNGSHAARNTTATFSQWGSYGFTVTITDSEGLSATSSVTVAVYPTLAGITVSPSSVSLGPAATQQFSATAFDQFGNALGAQPSFTWSTSLGSIGTNGLWTAPATSGSGTVTATSGSASAASAVTVTNHAPTVDAAAGAAPNPATGTTSALSVLGADADTGEANLTYTWAATGLPGGAAAPAFSANGTNAARNTTAIFSRAGSYAFQVTITDTGGATVTSSVNFTVDQTLTSITVSPSFVDLNAAGSRQFSATAFDQFGNALGAQPSFTWSTSLGSIGTNGLWTAPATSGSGTVTATSGSASAASAVTVTNHAPTVDAAAGAAPNPATGTTSALSVLGADADTGEANLTYTWAATGLPGGAAAPAFSANGTNAARNTTAIFSRAGSYAFQVTITDTGGATVTSSVSVTVVQTLTNIEVSPVSVILSVGATQQFSATGFDQFGGGLAIQPTFTWSTTAGTISSTGLLTAPTTAATGIVRATGLWVDGAGTATVIPCAPATIGLVDTATSTFYLRDSNTTGHADYTFAYGDPTQHWREIVGDWDGGGDTVGFFDPATATWYLRNSLTVGYADWTFGYGDPALTTGHGDHNWVPLVGDWDGNGTDTIGFFDPATCTWYLRNSLTAGYADWTFGCGDPSLATGHGDRNWQPLVGDWDSNGTDTVGLFDPEHCVWYLRNSLSTGLADHTFACGDPSLAIGHGADNWQVITGDWDGVRGDSIGFFDPQASAFMLRNSLTTGAADLTCGYGDAGARWHPLVGTWQTGSPSSKAASHPAAKAVDQIDLAALVCLELSRDPALNEPNGLLAGLGTAAGDSEQATGLTLTNGD